MPSQVNVRMITGDHLSTAEAVAIKCGIVRRDELEHEGVAMTGEDFRREVGRYVKDWDKAKNEYRI